MTDRPTDEQPDRLWDCVREKLDVLGITRVSDVTGLDRLGVPVWQAVRPYSKTLAVSQGKGLTSSGARASAVMESIENAVLERGISDDLWIDTTYRFEPEELPPFAYPRVVSSGLREVSLPSLELISLSNGSSIFWPVEAVRLDFTVRQNWTQFPVYSTSNGVASSDNRDGALLHALQELVERDVVYGGSHAVSEWVLAPIPMGVSTGVDLLLDKLERANVGAFAAVMGVRGGLTVVQALILPAEGGPSYSGTAARPTGSGAVLAALLEAVQSRLTAIAGGRDDVILASLVTAAQPLSSSGRSLRYSSQLDLPLGHAQPHRH